MNKTKAVILALVAAVSLSGCSAITTAVKKRNLDVKTQMSQTVWLDPVPDSEHTVYLQIRNTSDKKLDIVPELTRKLEAKGYTVTKSSTKAHYWIQANILKADKMDLRDSQGFLSGGYGAALGGGAIGLALLHKS